MTIDKKIYDTFINISIMDLSNFKHFKKINPFDREILDLLNEGYKKIKIKDIINSWGYRMSRESIEKKIIYLYEELIKYYPKYR